MKKSTLSSLSKHNPRKYWKYINKYKDKTNNNGNDIDMNDFVKQLFLGASADDFSKSLLIG